MAKVYQIATVLYEVLKTVVPASKIDEKAIIFELPMQLIIQCL